MTEVLDRLLELNHKRYAEEVARGLHAKAGSKRVTKAESGRRPERDCAIGDTLFD